MSGRLGICTSARCTSDDMTAQDGVGGQDGGCFRDEMRFVSVNLLCTVCVRLNRGGVVCCLQLS
jgi:hypothetical protein